jgi:Ser/Thr protein kinase RdoA (MazF antagonist)
VAGPAAISDALKAWAIEANSVETLAGFVNEVFLVQADGRKYVLRCARRCPPVERIDFQVRFAEFLITRAFRAPRPVRTPDGASCAVVGGVPWTLETFIEGSTYDFARIGQAAEAGRRLDEFHEAAEGFEAQRTELMLNDDGPEGIESYAALGQENPEQLRRLFDGAGLEDELSYFAGWHARVVATPWRQRLDALPQSWLHGDYHGRNMVFSGDEMVGLFDFDDVTCGPRIFDVAKGVYAFSRERAPDAQPQDLAWTLQGRGSLTLRADYVSAFLNAFQTRCPLARAERAALPFMAVLMWAPLAGFYESRLEDEGMDSLRQRLQRDVRMMRGIKSEMQRMAKQFGWSES